MNRRKFLNYTSLSFGASIMPELKFKQHMVPDHKIDSIRIIVPSIIEIGEEFEIKVSILTKPFFAPHSPNWNISKSTVASPFNISPRGISYMQNIMPTWEGSISIGGGEGYIGPNKFEFSSNVVENESRPIRRIKNVKFNSPGIKYIKIRIENSDLVGVSNPIQIVEKKYKDRVYWGDLHMHTIYTDGIRIPEQVYSFARDEAFLDICALSEHSEGLSRLQWDHFTQVTNKFYDAGKFVTLVGGEWTNMKFGHRNYYYRDRGPLLSCRNPEYENLDQLYSAARKYGALIIPHHSASDAMGVNWDFGHDPLVERLVEIHSIWGNSERSAAAGNQLSILTQGGEKLKQHVVDGLAKGYKLGFTAGGDIHDGRPGDELHSLQVKPESYKLLRKQGIMGVWAKELTRESIFDALWNRQVYGTTNHRTILHFSINDFPMGSAVKFESELNIKVSVISNLVVDKIELVKNGVDGQTYIPKKEEMISEWSTVEPLPDSNSYYYVRVTFSDGSDLAWSSPIWITK